jgi:hypothetical protein
LINQTRQRHGICFWHLKYQGYKYYIEKYGPLPPEYSPMSFAEKILRGKGEENSVKKIF